MEVKTLSNEGKLRELVTGKYVLKEMLKKVPQIERLMREASDGVALLFLACWPSGPSLIPNPVL